MVMVRLVENSAKRNVGNVIVVKVTSQYSTPAKSCMMRKKTGPMEPSHVVPLPSCADLTARTELGPAKPVTTSGVHVETAIALHSKIMAKLLL